MTGRSFKHCQVFQRRLMNVIAGVCRATCVGQVESRARWHPRPFPVSTP